MQARLIGDTLIVRDGNSLIVYAPASGKIARLQGVQDITPPYISLLEQSGFCKSPPVSCSQDNEWSGFGSLTLLLTRACNLRCIYCYASAKPDGKSMPIELALDAVDFYASHLRGNQLRICFHGGGEPTLAMDLIRATVQRAAQAPTGRPITYLVTTNGTAPQETYQWMMANNFKVSISMDGPPAVQDRNRPFANGSISSIAVARSIRLFTQSGHPVTVRLTYAAGDNLTASLEYFAELGVRSIHLEPLFPYGRDYASIAFGSKSKQLIAAPSTKEMVSMFLQAMDTCERLGIVIHNSHFMNLGNGSGYFCSLAAGRGMVVTHDGLLTGCLEIVDGNDANVRDFHLGAWDQPKHSFVVDTSKLQTLRSRHADRLSPCKTCFARYTCAGGCAAKAIRQFGNFSERDMPYCGFTKAVLPVVVRRIATASHV